MMTLITQVIHSTNGCVAQTAAVKCRAKKTSWW